MKKGRIIYVILLCMIAFCLQSCGNKDGKKKFYDTNNVEQQIAFKRFDKALFAKPEPNLAEYLQGLQQQYPDMFAAPLSNQEYLQQIMQMVTDQKVQQAVSIIEKEYPDLSDLSVELTSAFARLKEIDEKTTLPQNVYTMVLLASDFSYGYANRVYMNDTNYFVIALDIYSLQKLRSHPYYSTYPEYMVATLTKDYIAADFMRMYLQNATFRHVPMYSMREGATLLDCIIEDGKYSYVTKKILPERDDCYILRYTPEQMQWVRDNEANIWAFAISRKLLYETDRSKYMSLIAEGPETKGLNSSPARVGNYLGYRIIEQFMKETKISIDSLMKISDASMILNTSKYKPQK